LAVAAMIAGWAAAPQARADRFEEQLAAGEFAPALETAQENVETAQRDAMLLQLAAAQAKAGAADSAFHTLASVTEVAVRPCSRLAN
jgi:hypothetical protein